MPPLLQDLRFGLRTLLRSPGWTAVAVLSLGLGIGANTTTFCWLDSLLLRPFSGVTRGEELAALETVTRGGEYTNTSYPDFRDYRDHATLLSGVAAYSISLFSLDTAQQAEPVWAEVVSGNFFTVLGVRPALGRMFTQAEVGDQAGGAPFVVLSHGLWKRRFHSDPAIAGKPVLINRHPFTVVGVAPADFHGAFIGIAFDLWIPLTMEQRLDGSSGNRLADRNRRPVAVMARLKPGVRLEQARAEIDTISRRLALAYPDSNRDRHATLIPLWKAPNAAPSILGRFVGILMGVSGLVLLIVCANVANLLLARSTARQREFAIRLGIGAGRARLVRQLLTESLLLSFAGAGAGILLSGWMVGAVLALAPPAQFPLSVPSRIDARVLAFTVLISMLASVLFGLAPALASVRGDLHAALREGSHGSSAGSRPHRLRRLLVVSEIALALVTLIGAGLFLRSFANARRTDLGFDPRNVQLVSFNLISSGYNGAQGKLFFRRLCDRLQGVPGIEGVAYATGVPLGFEIGSRGDLQVEGYTPRPGENMRIYGNEVSPGYFRLMRIPLLEGRDFSERDDENAPHAAIVSEAFVRRFYPGRYPIGRRIRVWRESLTIVGVAATSKYVHLEETPQPYIYLHLDQTYSQDDRLVFHIRATGPPEAVMPAVRREVRDLDPSVAIFGALKLSDYIGASVLAQKVSAAVLGVLGSVALLLAGLGLYSVTAYSVAQRTHEIGIRIALGAGRRDVLRLVLGEGMRLSAAGVALGLAAALVLTRLMSSLLFGVSPTDPLIFAAAPVFLAALVLLAAYAPARRALRVDPMVALRDE